MQGRLKLSCGHVDNDRMIIHDGNPNQGYIYIFLCVLGGGGDGGRVEVQGKERNNNSHKSHTVPPSLSPLKLLIF